MVTIGLPLVGLLAWVTVEREGWGRVPSDPVAGAIVLPAEGVGGNPALFTVTTDGSHELTAEEYFDQLNHIADDAVAALDKGDAAFYEVVEGDPSEEDFLKAARTWFDENLKEVDDALKKFEDLSPPTELQAAHDEYIESLRAFAELIRQLRDDLEDADTRDEADEILRGAESAEFFTAEYRLYQACFALQAEAEARSIEFGPSVIEICD